MSKLTTWNNLEKIVKNLRENNPKVSIGTVNGTFDLLHPGHVDLLEKAKSECDYLIVLLNSDKSVKLNKGKYRPIMDQLGRARMLSAIEYVDVVYIFDKPEVHEYLEMIRPDVHIKGARFEINRVQKEMQYVGRMVYFPTSKGGYSTTKLIDKIRRMEQ
jgi:rfaE bifunctional protein nucleotidyltransferase chain/domain